MLETTKLKLIRVKLTLKTDTREVGRCGFQHYTRVVTCILLSLLSGLPCLMHNGILCSCSQPHCLECGSRLGPEVQGRSITHSQQFCLPTLIMSEHAAAAAAAAVALLLPSDLQPCSVFYKRTPTLHPL